MQIEKFDFKDFFDEKRRYLKFGKDTGVGAVSIITPSQAITRWNKKAKDNNGNVCIGGGSHIDNALYIVRRILDKKIYQLFLPGFYSKDYLDESFLFFSVYVVYVNGSNLQVNIFLPKKISSYQEAAILYYLDEIRLLNPDSKVCLEISENGGESIDETLLLTNDDEYEEIKKFIRKRVNSVIDFPYSEKTIVSDNSFVYGDTSKKRQC